MSPNSPPSAGVPNESADLTGFLAWCAAFTAGFDTEFIVICFQSCLQVAVH
jgi:hypothetical protein